MSFFKKIKNKNGFTLIETLVAISILLLSIVGPLEIASKGLFSAFYARDEILAYYLAQEGLEFIRNIRDSNYIQSVSGIGVEWLDSVDLSCFDSEGCAVNPVAAFAALGATMIDCEPDCPVLKYNDTNAIFSINGSSDPVSKFTRKVSITLDNSDISLSNSALVETTVSWQTGTLFSSTKSFVLRERIFNWNK